MLQICGEKYVVENMPAVENMLENIGGKYVVENMWLKICGVKYVVKNMLENMREKMWEKYVLKILSK